MACQAKHFWTLTGLVCAFLDLFIAYFLLCASTVVFFGNKFLGFFGLSLPCPCNGYFTIPVAGNNCIKTLLIDYPTQKISSVQLSAKDKVPFDSVFGGRRRPSIEMMKFNGEFDGEEACCSLISDGQRSSQSEREFDMRAEGVMSLKPPRSGFRRRRKRSSVGNRRLYSSSSSLLDGANSCRDEGKTSMAVREWDRSSEDLVYNQASGEIESANRISSRLENSSVQEELAMDGDSKNIIRVLEQELEEEQAARAALYLELEKERNAAATAADEAMAMILRLQEEKATIEMEARQYQRVIEEKSQFDEEEMNILKEILLRREREKHFLEKEVEAYRKMIYLGNGKFEGLAQDLVDIQKKQIALSLDSTEDPDQFLQQLSDSIAIKKILEHKSSDSEIASISDIDLVAGGAKEFPFQGPEDAGIKAGDTDKQISQEPEYFDQANQELHEKEMVSMNENSYGHPKEGEELEAFAKLHESSCSQEINLNERTISVVLEDQRKDSDEADKRKASSNVTVGLPPPRRNSTSALDNERLKIDSEVEWLREKLRIVQEEREKLNLSMEHREREKLQLNLLEDIARQIREIRLLTEPGKAHQAPLPPVSSKVPSKKRRCRSVSLSMQKSV